MNPPDLIDTARALIAGDKGLLDHKWFRNLAIARIVVEYLEGLDMRFPLPAVNLEHIRREYHAAKNA
jgi:hypothetical protein